MLGGFSIACVFPWAVFFSEKGNAFIPTRPTLIHLISPFFYILFLLILFYFLNLFISLAFLVSFYSLPLFFLSFYPFSSVIIFLMLAFYYHIYLPVPFFFLIVALFHLLNHTLLIPYSHISLFIPAPPSPPPPLTPSPPLIHITVFTSTASTLHIHSALHHYLISLFHVLFPPHMTLLASS